MVKMFGRITLLRNVRDKAIFTIYVH